MSRFGEPIPLKINTPHPKVINFQPDEGSALTYRVAFPSSAADGGEREEGPAGARLLLIGMLISLE